MKAKKALLILLVCALMLLTVPLQAQAANDNPRVIPPMAKTHGKTLGEWSAAWWQWVFSLPVDQNPMFDEGEAINGANGQEGPVWFLAGSFTGTPVVRYLTVPAGTTLFVHIIGVECSTVEAPPFFGANETDLRTAVNAELFEFADVFATVDGVAIKNLEKYLVESPMFAFTVPENNVLGVPEGTEGQSMARDYNFMLAPLPVGDHVIHVGGMFPNVGFFEEVTYNITVVPRKK